METFQIVGETFFSHPGNLARTEKCLKGFMISAHCTLLHGVQANQAHRPSQPSAQNEQTTDPCGIPEVRPRLQTSGPTSAKCFMCHVPPPPSSFHLPHHCLIHKGYQESQQKYQETAGCNWTVFLDETQFLTIS